MTTTPEEKPDYGPYVGDDTPISVAVSVTQTIFKQRIYSLLTSELPPKWGSMEMEERANWLEISGYMTNEVTEDSQERIDSLSIYDEPIESVFVVDFSYPWLEVVSAASRGEAIKRARQMIIESYPAERREYIAKMLDESYTEVRNAL